MTGERRMVRANLPICSLRTNFSGASPTPERSLLPTQRPAALPILAVPIGDRDVVRAAFAWNLVVEIARLGGSSTLLIYAIHRGDPVFILGQSMGSFVYLRNLYFIYRERSAVA